MKTYKYVVLLRAERAFIPICEKVARNETAEKSANGEKGALRYVIGKAGPSIGHFLT